MSNIVRKFTDPRRIKNGVEVTVRADGSVVIEEGGYYGFLIMSPKQAQGVRDMLVELLGGHPKVVDPEGEPKTPESAPPVARPDLPPVKVRVDFQISGASESTCNSVCNSASKGLPVPGGLTFAQAELEQQGIARQIKNAIDAWVSQGGRFAIEFDLQADTATVVRPKKE